MKRRFWSEQLTRGFRALPALDRAQYAEIRFEDLVAAPEDGLRRIAAFFELDPEAGDWIARAAALIRGVPPTRLEKLAPEERERLLEACRPGSQLLGRVR